MTTKREAMIAALELQAELLADAERWEDLEDVRSRLAEFNTDPTLLAECQPSSDFSRKTLFSLVNYANRHAHPESDGTWKLVAHQLTDQPGLYVGEGYRGTYLYPLLNFRVPQEHGRAVRPAGPPDDSAHYVE